MLHYFLKLWSMKVTMVILILLLVLSSNHISLSSTHFDLQSNETSRISNVHINACLPNGSSVIAKYVGTITFLFILPNK